MAYIIVLRFDQIAIRERSLYETHCCYCQSRIKSGQSMTSVNITVIKSISFVDLCKVIGK